MAGKIKCFVFDLDGTILHRPTSLPSEATQEALRLLCNGTHNLDALTASMKQISSRFTCGGGILASKTEQFRLLLKTINIENDSLVDRLFERYMEHYLSKSSLYADVIDALVTISTKGIRIGLITNSPDDIVSGVLTHFGARKYFDFIVAASQVGHPKPSIEFSKSLVGKACSKPSTILIAGDGDEDSSTAEMLGALFYRVNRNPYKPVLNWGSNKTVENLHEILKTIELA